MNDILNVDDLTIDDIASFHVWARLAIDNESISFDDETRLDWFGSGDGRCLVIDHRLAGGTEQEYTFLPSRSEREEKLLIDTFEFLGFFDFKLRALLEWLDSTQFEESENGEVVKRGPIIVSRQKIRLRKPLVSEHD